MDDMSKSRTILIVLLLASVTCVVVVQVTMDGWNTRSSLLYKENTHAIERHKLAAMQHETTDISTMQVTNTLTTTTSVPNVATTKVPNIALSAQKLVTSSATNFTKTQRPREKSRRLPLGRTSYAKQLLISRQDKLQEILKRSSALQRRAQLDPMRALQGFPVVNLEHVTRVIIVTYFRAGSSFVGDMLQQNWKTFYQFEPLHSMTYDSRVENDKLPKVFGLLSSIFKCNFTGLDDFLMWVRQPQNQFLFGHNSFLWSMCRSNSRSCFDPKFVNAVCQRAPVHVMKITRLHMHQLKSFLNSYPDLNVKVIYLARDPRGIISSRWKLEWCNKTQCSDPGVLCREMSSDIEIFKDLQTHEPSNFIQLRYEDLSLNPEAESRKLFHFLNLPFSTSVQRFLKTHTVSRINDRKNPYSTHRNSSAMAFSWHERFTFDQVKNVQGLCGQVLDYLNYSLITAPSQLPFPYGIKVKNRNKNLNQSHVLVAQKKRTV